MAREITVEKRQLNPLSSAVDTAKAMWWTDTDDNLHKSVWSVVQRIESRQRARWTMNLTFASLYENMLRTGFGTAPMMIGTRGPAGGLIHTEVLGSSTRSSHNVVKSCIDTAVAKIAKAKPRVKFCTTEGSWSQQRKARKLTQYVDGLFYASDAYGEGIKVFRDACTFGTGILKVFADQSGNVKVERIVPLEIVIDDDDGIYGKPCQAHQRKQISRLKAKAMWPDHADDIEHAQSPSYLDRSAADEVMIVESWHLKSGPDAKDGRHTICVDNATLLSEEYDEEWLPFVKFNWCDRLVGYWGLGLAEELAGIQLRINKLDKQISAAQEFMCIPRVFVDAMSEVSGHKLFDFGVVKYKGNPPVFNTAPAMPPEIYQERENEIKRAYEITGISQMSASGQKPQGLNSGAAQREFQDINAERFSIQGDRYENMFLEVGRIMIAISRKLYADKPELSVKAKGRKFIKTIKWSEVNLDDDQFFMQTFPVSQLPRTPEGKLQFIQELTQAGFIDRDAALELMQFGDTDDSMSLLTSAFDDAIMLIDHILDNGANEVPCPYSNLTLTRKLAQSNYLRAQVNGAPTDRLDALARFLDNITAMIGDGAPAANQNAAAAGPGAPPEGGGTPLATPQAPPTSDLLPNAPAQAA